jgi:hypothetical protein
MDWRSLANPSRHKEFPTASCRVIRVRGIATKIDDPAKEHMGGTSPLHWWLRKDINNKVIVQNKFTCEDNLWSAAAHVWNDKAPRPDSREFVSGTSGLLPTDLRIARRRPLSDKREKILRKSLDAIMGRVTQDEGEQLDAIFSEMGMVPTEHELARTAPAHGGKFECERDIDSDEEDQDHPQLELAQRTMFETQSAQNRAREERREKGYSKNLLVIGNFIAYEPNYTTTTKAADRSDFWVGEIVSLNRVDREVNIRMYHTPTKRNGNANTRNSPMYKAWTGNRSNRQTTDSIAMSRVYETFSLTAQKRIRKRDIRYIMKAKDLRLLDGEEEDQFPGDLGIVRVEQKQNDGEGDEDEDVDEDVDEDEDEEDAVDEDEHEDADENEQEDEQEEDDSEEEEL